MEDTNAEVRADLERERSEVAEREHALLAAAAHLTDCRKEAQQAADSLTEAIQKLEGMVKLLNEMLPNREAREAKEVFQRYPKTVLGEYGRVRDWSDEPVRDHTHQQFGEVE